MRTWEGVQNYESQARRDGTGLPEEGTQEFTKDGRQWHPSSEAFPELSTLSPPRGRRPMLATRPITTPTTPTPPPLRRSERLTPPRHPQEMLEGEDFAAMLSPTSDLGSPGSTAWISSAEKPPRKSPRLSPRQKQIRSAAPPPQPPSLSVRGEPKAADTPQPPEQALQPDLQPAPEDKGQDNSRYYLQHPAYDDMICLQVSVQPHSHRRD